MNPQEQLPAPSLAEVDAIAAMADPVVRNLRITHCYFELSRSLAARLPGANWCTFATWASKQAGVSIRGEDLDRALSAVAGEEALAMMAGPLAAALRALGGAAAQDRVATTLWRLASPSAAVARAGAAVARGNLKVFAEIAREFARFHAAGLDGRAADAPALEAFLAALSPGEPPDGQIWLRRAFTHYRRALESAPAHESGQWLLLANLEIGFHEQTRLQPEIREALDTGLPDARVLTDALARELLPPRSIALRLRLAIRRLLGGTTPLEAAAAAWLAVLRARVRAVLTEHLMTLELPRERRLRLGQDVPGDFPPPLRDLTNRELIALLARIDPTTDRVAESGTRDWADLADRMHFIADLFRCFQGDAVLFDAPFTADQVSEMRAGRRPAGPL